MGDNPFADLIPQRGSEQGGVINLPVASPTPVTTYSIPASVGGADESYDSGTAQGHGSSDNELAPGVVAVNPDVYPIGTIFKDADTGEAYVAGDKHGNANPNVIDIYTPPSQYTGFSGQRNLVPVGRVPANQIPKTAGGVGELLKNFGKVPEGEGAYTSLGRIQQGSQTQQQQMENPFADLIPKNDQSSQSTGAAFQSQASKGLPDNPFADLIPSQETPASFGTAPTNTGKAQTFGDVGPDYVPSQPWYQALPNQFAAAAAKSVINTIGGELRGLSRAEQTPEEATATFDKSIADQQAALNSLQSVVAKKGFATADDQNRINQLKQQIQNTQVQKQATLGGQEFTPQEQADLATRRQEAAQQANLMSQASKEAETIYNANPQDASTAAGIGRGLGSIFGMAPAMLTGGLGIPLTAVQAGNQAYAEAYDSKVNELKKQGITDQKSIDDAGHEAGSQAAVATVPQLGAYLVGGKLTSEATGALLKEATPLVKGLAGGAAAAGVNVATSAGLRGLEGQPLMLTAEGTTQDILFGALHGLSTGMEASAEAKKKADAQLGGPAPEVAPSANPVVNEREAQILASADSQAPIPEAPKPTEEAPALVAETPANDLRSLTIEQAFHDEGSPEHTAIQQQIDALNKPAEAPVASDVNQQIQDLTNENNRLVIEELPKYPQGSVGRRQIQDRIDQNRLQQVELLKQRELVLYGEPSAEEPAQPTQQNESVQKQGAREVGVRNAPAVGEGVGAENEAEVPAPQGEEKPQEEVDVSKYYSVYQAQTVEEVDAFVKKKRKQLEDDYKAAIENRNGPSIDQIPKQLKALGMQASARKRDLTGNLTAKEKIAKEKRESSNYMGKPVSVEGKNGKVVGTTSFGRVPVRFEDGKEANIPREKIESPIEQKPTTPTIETHGEGNLFQEKELPFNLAGETMAPEPENPTVGTEEEQQLPLGEAPKPTNPYTDLLNRFYHEIRTHGDFADAAAEVAKKEKNKYLKAAVDKFREQMEVGEDPDVEALLSSIEREANHHDNPPEPIPSVKRGARELQGGYLGIDPVMAYLQENPIMSKSEYLRRVKKGEIKEGGGVYDDAPTINKGHASQIYSTRGEPIDTAVEALVDQGLMPEGSTASDLWNRIEQSSKSAEKRQAEEARLEKLGRQVLNRAKETEKLRTTNPELFEQERNQELQDWFDSRRKGGEAAFTDFPKIIYDGVVDVAKSLSKAGKSFADWSRDMASRLGDGVRKYLRQIYHAISTGGGRILERAAERGSIDIGADERFKPKAQDERLAFAKKVADAVAKGKMEPITEQEMQNILSRKFPGITSREASDLYASATGKPKPPVAEVKPPVTTEETPEKISIRTKDQEDQVRRGILTSPVPAGEGTSRAGIIEQGNANLRNGADPFNALEKAKQGDFNALTTAKAYANALAKQVSEALKKFGPQSKEYKDLAKQYQDYYEGIREAGTIASDILRTFQGETDLSDAADIAREYTKITGQEPTLSQHEQIRKVADKVDTSIKEAGEATQKVRDTLDESLSDVDVKTPESVEEGQQQIADLSDAQGKKAKDEIDRLNSELEQTKQTLEEVRQAKETGQDAESLKSYYEAKIRDLNNQLESQPKFGKEVFEQARKIVDKWKADAAEAEKQLRKQLNQMGSSPDPTIILTLARIMRAHIGELALDFTKSSAMLIEKFGPKIKPSLKDAWAKAHELINGENGGEKAVKTIRSKSSPEYRRIKSLEKQVSDNEEKIASLKEGKLPESKTSQKATNDRIKALEDQTKQQRKQISELKKKLTEKPLTLAEKAADNLRKRISQYEKKIKDIEEGRVTTPKDVEKVTNEEIQGLEKDLAEKKQQLSDARLKAKQRDLFAKDKIGEKLNPEQVKTLWETAKKFYLDKGESDWDKMVNDLASDLGLLPDQVRRGLASPKGAKKVSDDMYLKQRNRQMALDEAKRWLENQKASWVGRVFGSLAEKTFKLAIFGHGTAFIGTHAPTTLYTHPRAAFKAWLKGLSYSFRGKNGRIQNIVDNKDLIYRPNWTVARRAGLENDPRETRREGATPARSDTALARALDTISGGRGFDALFHLRQDMFDQAWEKLSITQRTPEMAEMLAESINNATGFTKGGDRTKGILQSPITKVLFFAPKLIASRFKWLIQDPAKMLGTFAKMANPLTKVTPEERMSAFYEAKNKAKFLGFLTGTLLANQALLSVTGSNQNINFFNPKKNDWLAYKGFGYNLSTIGAFTRIARLVAQEYNAVFGDLTRIQKARGGREAAMKDALYTYFRSGFSPITRDIIVGATGKDYLGNVVPWSSQQPDRGRRRLTWGEIVQEQFAPIPISEAATQKEFIPAAAKAGSAAFLGTRLETPADIEEYEKSFQSRQRTGRGLQ